MAPWTKLFVMVLLAVSPAQSSPSSHNEVEPDLSRTSSNRSPSPERVDYEGVESQQVSLITTIEYLPVETKKIGPSEHMSHQTKGEEYEQTGHTKANKSYENSIGHERSGEDATSVNRKEGHHKRRGEKYKGGEHASSHSDIRNKGVKGHKGHAIEHKGHENKGGNKKGFQNVWQKDEHGRGRKFYDDAVDLKYHSNHDHLHVYEEMEDNKKYSGGGRENVHEYKEHGEKHRNQVGGSHDKFRREDKSYGHRENHGHRSSYQKKGGHEKYHGSSKGNKNALETDTEDHENHGGHESQDGHGNRGDNKERGSHSCLKPIRIVVRRRKLGPVKNDEGEDAVQEASSKVLLKEEASKQEEKFGQKNRKKKAKSTAEASSQTNAKPSEEVSITKETKRLKRIPSKHLSVTEFISQKVLPKRTVIIPLHEGPMSLFVRKKDLDKLKTFKVGGGKYAGYIADRKKAQNNQKYILYRENNEIANEDQRDQEKDIATTVEKPVVVAKPIHTSYSSKEDISAKVDKPQLIPISILKKEKTQEVSVVSDVKLEPSSMEKQRKPTGYKTSIDHKASHHQAAGKKTVKGGSQSSGHKGNHHGDYQKNHDSKFFDKEAKKDSGHNHQKHYGGHYKAGKKASKGHAHGTKNHHSKGHSDKGFKNVHHKLEYSSKKNFYDDDEDKKYHDIFNNFDVFFARKMKENLEANKFYGGDHHKNNGHNGYDFDKLFEDHEKSYQNIYGHHDNYGHYHHHGNKKHHKGDHHRHHDHH